MSRPFEMMTETRLRILQRWWVWTQFYGAQPSYRELGAFCGIRSTNSISEQIKRLLRDGWLQRDPNGQQRALSITAEGRALLKEIETPVVVVPCVGRLILSF